MKSCFERKTCYSRTFDSMNFSVRRTSKRKGDSIGKRRKRRNSKRKGDSIGKRRRRRKRKRRRRSSSQKASACQRLVWECCCYLL